MCPNTHTFLYEPRTGERGGGVGIFLSNAFHKLKVYSTMNYEHMQVGCEVSGSKCVLIVVYRRPRMNLDHI